VLHVDARGTRLRKEHKHSTRRIDLAVAMVMAHARACALAETDYDLLQSVW
jgi:phage terminase large subunit-like protein